MLYFVTSYASYVFERRTLFTFSFLSKINKKFSFRQTSDRRQKEVEDFLGISKHSSQKPLIYKRKNYSVSDIVVGVCIHHILTMVSTPNRL